MTDTDIDFLIQLEKIIADRATSGDPESYTVELLDSGRARIAQKLGEEALELALAAVDPAQRNSIADEAADLIYHLMVLMKDCQLELKDIAAVLRRRHESV